jgi:hypothetical protein
MATEINGECKVGELSIKRFYVPGITVEADCPECGKKVLWEGDSQYLSYPAVGSPDLLHMACFECGHGWSVDIVLEVGIRLAKPADYAADDNTAEDLATD